MPASSVLIGTLSATGTIAVTVSGGVNGTVNVTVPAGPLYLFDSTPALSYVVALAAAIVAQNSDVPGVEILLLRNRHASIEWDTASNVALTWGSNTAMRDALGFTGDLSGANFYTSENPCDLVWVPGTTEISSGRLGTAGKPVYDLQVAGPPGSTKPVYTSHNYRTINTLRWMNVDNSRVWVSETGGEHIVWWRKVLVGGRQFAHYRQVTMSDSDSAAATLATRVGPYSFVPPSGPVEYPYDRVVENVEFRQNVSMDVVQVAELS